jgi:hypothetical protein
MWKWIVTVPAIMFFVAYFDMPYGYYQFLRLFVTATAVWCMLKIQNGTIDVAIVALVVVALVYNPVAVVHMTREHHQYVNAGTAVIFAAVGWRFRGVLK